MGISEAWKAAERRVAKAFGSVRTPLSGGNSRHTGSDSLHRRLFIETKYGERYKAVVNLWDRSKKIANKERKIPMVAIVRPGRHGFWILFHVDDLEEISECYKEAREHDDIQETN